jgi:amino acid permease
MTEHEAESTLLTHEDKDTVSDLIPSDKSENHTYGSFVAYCFCVNYILGVGVLGVPYGFYKGGVIAGPLILFVVTLFAMMSATWIIESLVTTSFS